MLKKIKIIFFGADVLGIPIIDAIQRDANIIISAVVTRRAKPAGRSHKPQPNPLLKHAQDKSYKIIFVDSNSDWTGVRATFNNINPDIAVVAGFGRIIPQEILGLLPNKFINIHPSLLPRYRGPSPIETSILDNQKQTGVSFIIMTPQMDAGPLLAQYRLASRNYNSLQLSEKLSDLAASHISQIINKYLSGKIKTAEQDEYKSSYTHIITTKNGVINPKDTAPQIYRKFLAYAPWPGIRFCLQGKYYKIIDARRRNNFFIIDSIQPENKRVMTSGEFINGYRNVLTQFPKSVKFNVVQKGNKINA